MLQPVSPLGTATGVTTSTSDVIRGLRHSDDATASILRDPVGYKDVGHPPSWNVLSSDVAWT